MRLIARNQKKIFFQSWFTGMESLISSAIFTKKVAIIQLYTDSKTEKIPNVAELKQMPM